jgi:hypothetical protein
MHPLATQRLEQLDATHLTRIQTVAGYDLTFSPVRSVSTLWAVADSHLAAQIEQAHRAAGSARRTAPSETPWRPAR